MISVIGIPILCGVIAVSMNSLNKNNLKRRLINIMLACKIVTNTNKRVLYPKIVRQTKMSYGTQFIVRLPDGYPSEVVIDKWWIPIQEALGKEISLDFDKFLTIDIYDYETPKMIMWEVES
jgi:hypothetical protein